MSDETQAALHIDNAVISVQFVMGAIMSAMAWMYKRQDAKIEALEKEVSSRVTLEMHNNTLEALRREIRESGLQTQERIDKLLTFLAERK